jgi:hypothetical protein
MTERLAVGVILARHTPVNPWGEPYWTPEQVLPAVPAAAPWTELNAADGTSHVYAGEAFVDLHRIETANYLDNLVTGTPKLWVVLRPGGGPKGIEVVRVTADPSEGEGFTQAGSDIVEPVAMPPDIAEAIRAFCAVHHVERPFEKRERNRARSDLSRSDLPRKGDGT